MAGTRSMRLGLALVLILGAAAGASAPAAMAAASGSPNSATCRAFFNEESVSHGLMTLPGMPDPAILASFGVLRRAPIPGDAVPTLNSIGGELEGTLASYYPAAVRQLYALPDGRRYFLITGFEQTISVPPESCVPRAERPALKRFAEREQRRGQTLVYCIAVTGAPRRGAILFSAGGAGECSTVASINSGQRLLATASSAETVVDIVPDGVAAVRLAYRGGASVTAPVVENAFAYVTPKSLLRRYSAARKHRPGFLKQLAHHLSRAQQRQLLRELISYIRHVRAIVVPRRVEWLRADGSVQNSFVPTGEEGSAAVELLAGAAG